MSLASEHKTAILLFARSAKEEAQHKTLSHKGSDNLFLLDSLKQNALDISSCAQLPLYHFSEAQQTGNTFGERLTNSMAAVFDKGYEKVIVLGADCPDLTVDDIKSAERNLVSNQMVVGPDQRGGTFLFGLTAAMFHSHELKNLSWQTNELIGSIRQYASSHQCEIVFLDQKFDLNETADLSKHAGESHFLSNLLAQLFDCLDYQTIVCLFLTYLVSFENLSRRGPPLSRTTY